MLSGYFDIRERRREREGARAESERVRREQDANAERRHQEMMAMIAATIGHNQEIVAAVLSNSQNRNDDAAVRSLQQEVANLRAEIAELRRERSNGNPDRQPE